MKNRLTMCPEFVDHYSSFTREDDAKTLSNLPLRSNCYCSNEDRWCCDYVSFIQKYSFHSNPVTSSLKTLALNAQVFREALKTTKMKVRVTPYYGIKQESYDAFTLESTFPHKTAPTSDLLRTARFGGDLITLSDFDSGTRI